MMVLLRLCHQKLARTQFAQQMLVSMKSAENSTGRSELRYTRASVSNGPTSESENKIQVQGYRKERKITKENYPTRDRQWRK